MDVKIKELRKSRGMTQEELASRAGITPVSLSLIENNKHLPTMDVACRLAKALHPHLDDLFKFEEKEDDKSTVIKQEG